MGFIESGLWIALRELTLEYNENNPKDEHNGGVCFRSGIPSYRAGESLDGVEDGV